MIISAHTRIQISTRDVESQAQYPPPPAPRTNRIRYPWPNILGLTPLTRTASGSVELRRV